MRIAHIGKEFEIVHDDEVVASHGLLDHGEKRLFDGFRLEKLKRVDELSCAQQHPAARGVNRFENGGPAHPRRAFEDDETARIETFQDTVRGALLRWC